jgi:agmatinase
VDGLDPAVIPATGTPEPDGLTWRQALDILKTVAEAGEVVAVDCVELAPRPGLHYAEFAAARLLADLLNRILARR